MYTYLVKYLVKLQCLLLWTFYATVSVVHAGSCTYSPSCSGSLGREARGLPLPALGFLAHTRDCLIARAIQAFHWKTGSEGFRYLLKAAKLVGLLEPSTDLRTKEIAQCCTPANRKPLKSFQRGVKARARYRGLSTLPTGPCQVGKKPPRRNITFIAHGAGSFFIEKGIST